jgi:hypothetical protein
VKEDFCGGGCMVDSCFLFVYQPTKNRNKKEGKGRFLLKKEGLVFVGKVWIF